MQKGDYSGGNPIQIGLQMGEIPMNSCRRYFAKGASLAYLRMEASDRLLYKDIFIREKGYDEACGVPEIGEIYGVAPFRR